MSKKFPWHSSKKNTRVYHDNTKCTTGNNIEKKNIRRGMGGKKRLCKECGKLGRRGK